MKDREPVWFDVAQGNFGRELDPKFVEADGVQISQRWHNPRRLDAKMHRERFEADGCFYLREVRRGVVPYHLRLALMPLTTIVVARE